MAPQAPTPHAQLEQMMAAAFPATRPPRSNAYTYGARGVLQFLLLESPLRCGYIEGTADFDAFHAGAREGRDIWARHMEAKLQPARAQPANAADRLAEELLHAEKIILTMLTMLSSQQKCILAEVRNGQGVIGDGGTTRYHERRAALIDAGYAQPEPRSSTRPCADGGRPMRVEAR